MNLRGWDIAGTRKLAAACCMLALLSCSGAPTAPGGVLQVYVGQDTGGPAPGKTIEIVGTSLRQTTDAQGIAAFSLRPGTYVVRAYDINMGGPCCAYVDKTVEVHTAHTTRAQFSDCTRCV